MLNGLTTKNLVGFFFRFLFLMWTIFKVFIEFVTILLLFYTLFFWPPGMWDLSSPRRDGTCTPCTGKQSLNPWTTREVPRVSNIAHESGNQFGSSAVVPDYICH